MTLSLTPEQRKERAANAAAARWSKRAEHEYDWEAADLTAARSHLAFLRSEADKGSVIIQRRVSEQPLLTHIECGNPDCRDKNGKRTVIDIGSGRFAGQRSRNNPETGLMETVFACSAACWLVVTKNYPHRAVNKDVPQPSAETVLNESAKDMVSNG